MAKFDPVGAFQTGQGLGIKTQIQLGAYNEGVKQKLATEAARAVDYEEGLLRQTIDNFAEAYGSQQVPENSPFADAAEFNAFATDFYNNRKGNIQPKDFISIYGKQGGLEKLNSMGFSSAMLGFGKEIDINNSKFNSANELEPFVRTADPNRGKSGQFYSAPLTLGGKPIREVIQEFGTEGVPDNTISFTLDTLNQPYDTFKRDIRIGAGGTPALEFMGKASNIKWFDPSAEARQEREETLFDDSTTSDQSTPTSSSEFVPSNIEERQADRESQFFSRQDSSQDLTEAGLISFKTGRTANDTRNFTKQTEEFKRILGSDYYQDNTKLPGNYADVEWNKLTLNQKKEIKGNLQTFSDNNLRTSLRENRKRFSTEATSSRNVPGFTEENAQELEAVAEFYKKNQKLLQKTLSANPALYAEYSQDPQAFAVKYQNLEGLKPPTVNATQRKTINDAAKKVGATGNTVPTSVTDAVEAGDGAGLLDALKSEVGTNQGNIDSQTQTGLVAILQDNNNNLAALDQARRYKMALAITASLTDNQLSSAYGQAMLNFIEYGTLGGLSDQKQALAVSKYQLDLAKYAADGFDVSDDNKKLFDEIVNFESEGNKWEDDAFRRYASQIGIRLQEAAAKGPQGRGDLAVATSQAGALIDIYLAKNAGNSFIREFFTLTFAENPTYGGFNLAPDIVGIDDNNKRTLDPNKITKVQKFRNGKFVGEPISLNKVDRSIPGVAPIVKRLVLANAGGS